MSTTGERSEWRNGLGCFGLILLTALATGLGWGLGETVLWATGAGLVMGLACTAFAVWRDWLRLDNGCSVVINLVLLAVLIVSAKMTCDAKERRENQQPSPTRQTE